MLGAISQRTDNLLLCSGVTCPTIRIHPAIIAEVCGPELGPIREKLQTYEDAGFTHVFIHQVGPDQGCFLSFAERELLPKLQAVGAGPGSGSSS